MTEFSPLRIATQLAAIKNHLNRRMLDQGEGSAHASESDSGSMEVPGEETPPSVGSKEDKIEIPGAGNGKTPDVKSPEIEKEAPKPRASVLEYKSVSQVYVLRVPAVHLSPKIGCLRFL